VPHPNVAVERTSTGYLRLLLSHPDQRNALVPGMVAALSEAMQADSDAVVLVGSADARVLCSGADLSLPVAERAAVSDLLYQCCEHMITRRGSGRIKAITSSGDLLERLRAERSANRGAFDLSLGGGAG
jgi:enoyl-CoA hydratase/carnithine racemase